MNRASVKKELFGQRGLAGIGMADDRECATLLVFVGHGLAAFGVGLGRWG